MLGNTVKLQGTIKGSAPITVKWMKDSEILRDDDSNIKMVFESNVASLSITTVAISHGGKYSCQAENEAGQQKCEATLTVQGQLTSLMQRYLYFSSFIEFYRFLCLNSLGLSYPRTCQNRRTCRVH